MNHARQQSAIKSRYAARAGHRLLATLAVALGLMTAGSLGMTLALASPASAASAGAVSAAGRPATLTLSAHQVAAAGPRAGVVVLTARALGAGSAGLQVTFSVKVTQFEYAPLLQVGTATTNASGEATVTYQPTWNGLQEFVASAQAPSGAQLGPATATLSARATAGFTGTVEASRPDGTIGRWVVVGLLTLVACVWVTLIAVVVRVYLTMRAEPA